MHFTVRIIALTAALSALAPAAIAAQVELNFNEFGTATQPVAVDVLQGLQFRGAFGYGVSMLGNQDPENLDFASAGKGGFLLNKQRGQSSTDIILTLVQNAAGTTGVSALAASPAVFFQAITFNLWTKGTVTGGNANPNKLIATGVNGDVSRDMTPGGLDIWTTQPLTFNFDPLSQVTSLRFTAGTAAFALDDMVVTLTGATDPGGNVPEPASYGLVGMALLAAGAATRRKQRG